MNGSARSYLGIVAIGLSALLSFASGCASTGGAHASGPTPALEQADLFVAGTEGYHTFRIPSLLVTPKGTLLAFCEGRKHGGGDSGDIDVVLKRSTDSGQTWEPLAVVADDGPNTFGNPCPVFDRDTGTILLLLTHNRGEDHEHEIIARTAQGTRTVWIMESRDDGVSWSKPVEITDAVKRPDWTWYATGPGCGIQLRDGRLVIPCDHTTSPPKPVGHSHVIYSDDHGHSWQIGGIGPKKTNECQVVERPDGTLLLNMRNHGSPAGQPQHRAVITSTDRGASWSAVRYDAALPDPVCQASFIRLDDTLLFANPAGTKRVQMTVRQSTDGGETWPVGRCLHAGPAAYSALAVLRDGRIACLYECGVRKPYERIALARFPVDWLKAGRSQDAGATDGRE